VATFLAERGAFVVDADALGHRLFEEPSIRRRVLDRFGTSITQESGSCPTGSNSRGHSINRRALASIVFSDPAALHDLEAILHPAMRVEFEQILQKVSAETNPPPVVVLDAAVLLEAGWRDLCDVIVFVDAPRSQRLDRVRRHRGWTEAILDARERAQWPLETKRAAADFVLVNDASLVVLEANVAKLWSKLIDARLSPRADRKIGLTA
jgi:dephospho-CoA kinase